MDSQLTTCFLCNNRLDYTIYARCYSQNLTENSNIVSFTDNQEYKVAHVKCIAFFLELDIYNKIKLTQYTQLQQNDCRILNIVFGNVKNIKKDCYIEDCMICEKNPGKQCLLHCIVK